MHDVSRLVDGGTRRYGRLPARPVVNPLDEFSGAGPHRIRVDIAATSSAPAFAGELELHGDRAPAPLSVSHRTRPGHPRRAQVVPPLPDPLAVGHVRQGDDPTAAWAITSADGRLDVRFTPRGRKDVRHQLGLFEIDYFQLYGGYRGTMRSLDGTDYPVEAAHGVLESMRGRL